MSLTRPFSPPQTAPTPATAPEPPRPHSAGAGQILLIPLQNILVTKLVRDRSYQRNPDIDDLKLSIAASGLSNPIRVEPVGVQFELVQGWRRLQAYRALYAETRDPRFATIAASPMDDHAPTEALYRRMVDENMVRKDISWAEMGRLANSYLADPAIECDDLDQAVGHLFASATPQKRSYIRRFAGLMRMLEKVLEYPEAIPRALGLDLAQALHNDPYRIAPLCTALRRQTPCDAQAELDILRCFAGDDFAADPMQPAPEDFAEDFARHVAAKPKPARGRPARTTARASALMRLDLFNGAVSCTAAPGKLELRLDRDFTKIPRARLETAISAFIAALT